MMLKQDLILQIMIRQTIANSSIPIMLAGLPLIKNVRAPLATSVLIPLGLTAAASAKKQLFKRKFMDQVQQHY